MTNVLASRAPTGSCGQGPEALLRELAAADAERIRLLARCREVAAGVEVWRQGTPATGCVVVAGGTAEVHRGGRAIDLTATEFRLLAFLAANPRRVLSKSQILDVVWDEGFEGESNIVEIYISYLRKKVDQYDPPLIQTVRGVGYSLREARR